MPLLRLGVVFMALSSVARVTSFAQTSREDSVRRFLQNYAGKNNFQDDKETQYSYAFVDLNGDGKKEAIVYLDGRPWCGSGGCTTLILARDGRSWKIVTKLTITQPPIRVLTRTSNGWHGIGLWVRGGIQESYEAELRFNGKTYPTNPSVPPARPLVGEAAGQVVIPSSDDGTPFYR